FCIIDPEGDHEGFPGAVTLGTGHGAPTADEVLQLLAKPDENVVVNLIGMPVTDRPSFFLGLVPRLLELRARTGRPHWLLVDEAHHMLPASWEPGVQNVPQDLGGLLLVTVHPGQVNRAVLGLIDTVLAVGDTPERTLGDFAKAVGVRMVLPTLSL